MAEPINMSNEDAAAFFEEEVVVGTDTQDVTIDNEETLDAVADVTENQESAVEENQGSLTVEENNTEEEVFVSELVENKEIALVVEKPQVAKAKAVIKHKDEYHASLNKYISENDNYSVAEFDRMYNGIPSDTQPMEIIKAKFYSDPANEGITPRALARMFQVELEKYSGLDSDDQEDREVAEGMLKRDANIYLRQLESEKKSFREKYRADLEQEIEVEGFQQEIVEQKSDSELAAERDALVAVYEGMINPIIGDGFLTLKDKDGEIKIPVSNPKAVIDAAIDPMTFFRSLTVDSDGKPSISKFVKMVAFAMNEDAYNSTLIKHSKALGTQKIVSEIKNTAPIISPKVVGEMDENSDSFFESMMKNSAKKIK